MKCIKLLSELEFICEIVRNIVTYFNKYNNSYVISYYAVVYVFYLLHFISRLTLVLAYKTLPRGFSISLLICQFMKKKNGNKTKSMWYSFLVRARLKSRFLLYFSLAPGCFIFSIYILLIILILPWLFINMHFL